MKAKGSAFERAVVDYLRDHGHPYAERHYGAGRREDVGDVDGVVGWTIEAKNYKAMHLAEWSDEAEHERQHGRQRFAAAIAKRRCKPVAQSYVVMSLETFTRLLADDDVTA